MFPGIGPPPPLWATIDFWSIFYFNKDGPWKKVSLSAARLALKNKLPPVNIF